MATVRRTKLVEFLWRLHRWIYTATGGRLGSQIFGIPILLLTTTGRKSGQRRTAALYYFKDQDRFVVIASNAGDPRHPAWYLNLAANPEATVRAGPRRWRAQATSAEGEERERLWSMAVALDSAYAEYQKRTERQIPVVVLTPEAETD